MWRDTMNTRVERILGIVLVFFAAIVAIDLARAAADNPRNSGASEDEAAIKQVVAGFSDGWNSHDSHRTDTVKAIRYLTPDLASVDNYWSMTGAKARDGSDWPYRAGYVNFLMARRNGHWVIIVSHTADFNAKAPDASR